MDERMMQENRRISASQHARQQKLAARGRHEIGAAYHQCDTLPEVVDGDGKLVSPISVTVFRQQIPALLGWLLCLPTQ